MQRALVWFRDDLRIHDHPALTAAVDHAASVNNSTGVGTAAADAKAGRHKAGSQNGGDVVGLYVLDDHTKNIRPLGGAARWWLHHALESLRIELGQLGIPLLIRSGDPAKVVPNLAREIHADHVTWSRRYGAGERALDAAIKTDLPQHGIEVESFAGSLLHEPWQIKTSTGGPYKVFTPFFHALSDMSIREPAPAPEPVAQLRTVSAGLSGAAIAAGEPADLDLLPTKPDWAGGLRQKWDPTEAGGHRRLQHFIDEHGNDYDRDRDFPGTDGTSLMSPYLRFGQITPFQAWHAAADISDDTSRRSFRSELGWREFCWHLLYHFPQLPHENLREQFDAYPWRTRKQEPEIFKAWTAGGTGFAFVDAGMRELWETGHMHNRVRMAVASLLVKNLGIDWRDGEAWFWDTLVDADPASNPANWQWVAGCGMDAAPYFRIFNPERQRERFDPRGEYVHHWVPELDSSDYPEPLVDLKASREEALEHYNQIRGN